MSAPRLEARCITAGYGAEPVLVDLSVRLNAGEVVGLIGPNGSGKSTLLRVLSRTLAPQRGELRIDGEAAGKLSTRAVAQRIAFVPQTEPAVFDFTVRDVVLMGRHPWVHGLAGETDHDYALVERAMADMDVLPLADRPITALSAGERQRVLIARALAQSCPLLLLDEPTAHLDIGHQAEALRLARQLISHGAAVMAALHDLNLAAEYCDRLVLLCGHKLLCEGAPEQVLTVERLSEAYGNSVRIARNPVTGRPLVFQTDATVSIPSGCQRRRFRVHVICGAGSGVALFAVLVRMGFTVTAGVLNRLDSDESAAAALGIHCVVEKPFSPIGAEARAVCARLIGEADAVVVAEVPFGRGNEVNLELAAEAKAAGKPVFLVGSSAIETRDFTGGSAAAIWRRLLADGAVPTADEADLLAHLANQHERQDRPAPEWIAGIAVD